MTYDFDKPTSRTGTNSMKWDVAQGELPMWVADMDFETAPCILDAVVERAKKGIFGYTLIPEEWYCAYADWWGRRYGWQIDKEQLIFCTGVVPAISCLVKRFSYVGDSILLLTPVYDIFFHSVENAGRKVLESELVYKEGEYEIDFADLEEKLSRPLTTMMILCNPHNPVGKTWSKEELAKIGALCAKYGVVVLSDEIHCDLTEPSVKYTPYATASKDCEQNCIVCLSASKAFNIAGLQSAAVVVPNVVMRNRVNRALNSDELAEPNCFAAIAAAAALSYEGEEWLEALRRYLFENKAFAESFIERELPQVKCVRQNATYLMWLDCAALTDDASKLARFIREKTGLYLSSGNQYRGNGKLFLRLNAACRRELLVDGLNRLKNAVDRWERDE